MAVIKKYFKKIKVCLITTAVLIMANQSFSGQVSITGKVKKINNNTITIETIKAETIPEGSRVDLFFENSEGRSIPIGQWEVSGRGKGVIFATPVDVTGSPLEEMTAKISYSGEKRFVYNVKKAVAGDNAEAYYLLAMLHQNGLDEISRSSEKMVENLIISAEKGYDKAQFMLGYMYESGDNVIKDKEKAIYWHQKAADQGHKGAKMELELMEPQICGKEPNGREPKGQLLGIPFPEKSAREYAMAGYKYYLAKNYKMAVKEYEQGARMGHAGCQNMLGLCYYNGHSVGKDLNKARKLYEDSARQNNSSAIYNLGVMYVNGNGVKKDMPKARELFLKSANSGYPEAQFNLAVLYYNGLGVTKDKSTALKWFKKAADQDIPKAVYVLGQYHEFGWGTKKNMPKAKEYYKKAAELGDKDAIKKL